MTLVRDLNATATELQWIVDAYVMVFAGLRALADPDSKGRKASHQATNAHDRGCAR